jgi:hypothetical protein
MAQAISTTSALGFTLHDLKFEFVSRFKLLLQDEKAKAISNVHVKGRGALNAIIGKENPHFTKYSLLGHIYLFLLITMEEAVIDMTLKGITLNNANIEEKLTKQSLYKQLALFSREILSVKLALTARKAFEKYKNHYMLCSFYNLMEWRVSRAAIESNDIPPPFPQEYKLSYVIKIVFNPLLSSQ